MRLREPLELLTVRGRIAACSRRGILAPERETSLDEVLAALELPARRFQAELRGRGTAKLIDRSVNGIRVTLMPTSFSRAERSPDPKESANFLDLAEQVFDRFGPDVLLTYGGHPASLELMRPVRRRGIAVVFHLHNFGHSEPKGSGSEKDRSAFAYVSAVIFPAEYSRRRHARLLGLDGTVISDAIPRDRIVAADPEPKYVTFINPQPSKGMAVFARIAVVLNQRRSDIPNLVVEGRGTSDALARLPIDFSGLTNLHRTANTPDPRDFYRVSLAVLVPSLCRELSRSPLPPGNQKPRLTPSPSLPAKARKRGWISGGGKTSRLLCSFRVSRPLHPCPFYPSMTWLNGGTGVGPPGSLGRKPVDRACPCRGLRNSRNAGDRTNPRRGTRATPPGRPGRIFLRGSLVIFPVKPIVTPFPDIPMHIEQPKRVRPKMSDRRGVDKPISRDDCPGPVGILRLCSPIRDVRDRCQ